MPTPWLPPRTFWITLLDAVVIVVAGVALVTLLGATTRFDVAGYHVSIRSATNLLYASAVLLLVRAVAGGRTGLLPSWPVPDRAAFERQRAHFASPEPRSRRVVLCAAATLLGSVIWIVPHILQPRSVPDPGDPLFSAWRIARLTHQLVSDPRHLFDGNVFYPLPLTMTLSDSTILQAMLGAPFVLAGVDPLLVANVLTLIAFPACGLASFFAAWRITGDPHAGIVAGLLGAWYPFHAEHYSHLELQWVMFPPLAAVAGLRMLADPRAATGAWLGAVVAGQWLASMYLGVMLIMFLTPFLLIAALAWRVMLSRRLLSALGAAAAVSLPAFIGLALPYLQARDIRGERTIKEIRDGSAIGANYGHAHRRLTTYRSQRGRGSHRAERELFPGTSTLVLAATGAVPPLSVPAVAAIVAGGLTFDWSLGFNGLTYDELHRSSSVFRGMRIPARFSAIVGVALVLLGGIGTARLLRPIRAPNARAAACAAIALLVLFDLRMEPGVAPYPREIPPIYSRVTPDMVLVELPIDRQIDYMYFSTHHWAPMVGGYSGFPRYTVNLMDGFKAWPSAASIDYFRRTGATHLTYNCALEDQPGRCEVVLQMLASHPDLDPLASGLWEGKETRLYRIR